MLLHRLLFTGVSLGLWIGLSGCQRQTEVNNPATSVPSEAPAASTGDADTTQAQEAVRPGPGEARKQAASAGQTTRYTGGGYTITLTGVGLETAYQGCNAQRDCLVIPAASRYEAGAYTWENGEYRYEMIPAGSDYRLTVRDGGGAVLVDEVVQPAAQTAERSTGVADSSLPNTQAADNALTAANACEGDWGTGSEQGDNLSVYPVDDSQVILEARCFLAAYQGAYEYWLYRPSGDNSGEPSLTPINLAQFSLNETGTVVRTDSHAVGGLPTYDPTQQRLTLFTKYRGIGDCGSLAEYEWDGTTLAVVSFREKADCDGNYVDPQDYLQLYP